MDINAYTIILLFIAIAAGVLAGIYAGMTIAFKLLGEKGRKVSLSLWKELPKHNLNTGRIISSKNDISETKEDAVADETSEHDIAKEPKEPFLQHENLEDETDSLPESDDDIETEETSKDMENDDGRRSYMEFVCESVGQDAVSRMRAARKTQDNKYMNRINKKKQEQESDKHD